MLIATMLVAKRAAGRPNACMSCHSLAGFRLCGHVNSVSVEINTYWRREPIRKPSRRGAMTYGMSGFSLNWASANPARTEVLGDANPFATDQASCCRPARHRSA